PPFLASAERRRTTPPPARGSPRGTARSNRIASTLPRGTGCLRAEHRLERGSVALVERLPSVRGGLETLEPIEAPLPAGRVAGGRVRRQLVDQDEPRAFALGRELESERVVAPGEREHVRLVDLEHLACERQV